MAMDVSKLVEKARECVETRNYAYAMELYRQALTLSPNDVDARKELRAVAARYVKENGVSKTAAILRGLVPLIKLVLPSKDPERRMIAAEEYLKNDPGSFRVLARLGQAAFDAGHKETAVWVFEDLFHQNAANAEAARMLARAYKGVGKIPQAIEIYQKILKLKPGDREGTTELRNLSAQETANTIQDAATGADRGLAVRSNLKDEKETDRLRLLETGGRTPEEIRQVIIYVKEDLDKQSGNQNYWLKLGDLHVRVKEWPQAQVAYEKARELSPTEYRIKMKLQDLEMAKMHEPIEALREKSKAGDAAAKQQLREVEGKYYKYRLECFIERERNYITELSIAFELGTLYFMFKNYPEAAKRFQRTQNDPGKRAQSLLKLGTCFSSMGQEHLAEEAFTKGIDSIEVPLSQSDIRKALTYERGVLYQKLNRKAEALKDLQAIYAVDIMYRDVGERMKQVQ